MLAKPTVGALARARRSRPGCCVPTLGWGAKPSRGAHAVVRRCANAEALWRTHAVAP